MPNKLITMQQIRTIILYLSRGHSLRTISSKLSLSRKTVTQYAGRLNSSGLSHDELHQLGDAALSAIVYPVATHPAVDTRTAYVKDRMAYYREELARTGMTRRQLWEEYRAIVPDGYSYTQFCFMIAEEHKLREAAMHFEYQPADKMLIDFAGKKLSWYDREKSRVVEVPVLVCVLPFSGISYVAALPNASQPHLIDALNDCLTFFGGVPLNFKTDNMKQIVSKSCRYEPVFTEVIEQWAMHNKIGLQAARVRKPKDKAPVESEVKLAYQRIYAPLRNEVFYSLEELNQAILKQLAKHHQRTLQKRSTTRLQRFNELEKPFLQSLPPAPFVIRNKFQATVQKNYHIQLTQDWHHYSVPFSLIGKRVQVIYDTHSVEIFHKHHRVALHKRSICKNEFTTITEHMPQGHQHYYAERSLDKEHFLLLAEKTGTYTFQYVTEILKGKSRSEQLNNTCTGLFRLGKAYGNTRLEAACKRAIKGRVYNFRTVKNILAANLDKLETELKPQVFVPPSHGNIRGPEAFN